MSPYIRFARTLFVFVLIAAFAAAAAAQETAAERIARQASLVTEFDVNGLKVIVKRRPSSPTVAGGLFVRGGVRNITEKNAGIENLMLLSATDAGTDMPRQQVRRELSRLGSGFSAAAGQDYSAVSFAATRPSFDRVWEIFSSVILKPAFAKEDVERNRQQILTQLREMETSPEGALQALQDKTLYAAHPYPNEVIGTPATIAALTPDDLRAYHKKVMQTSQLLLVFVGDLDANDVKARVAATFGKLPRGDYKDQPLKTIDFSKPTFDVTTRSLPTNYIQGAFAAPSIGDPDYYAMQLMITILHNLVVQKVRNELQLSYAPAAELNKFAVNTGEISVSTTDPNQAVEAMLAQIELLRTRRLNDAIVKDIAASFLTSYYLGQETSGAQAGELARYELIGGGWRNSFEFLNNMMRVTSADVQRVSEKYMKNIRFTMVGDPQSADRKVFMSSAF